MFTRTGVQTKPVFGLMLLYEASAQATSQRLSTQTPAHPRPPCVTPLAAHLVFVKVVPHHSQAPCPQQVSVHELLAGLNIAAQPHTHQGQVLTHGEEVTTL